MREKGWIIKLWLAVLAVLLIGNLSSASVYAQDYDSNRKGSITIQLNDIETKFPNVVFVCYKIADVDENFYRVITPELEDTAVDLNALETSGDYEAAAKKLASEVGRTSVKGQKAETDESGKAVFSSLEQGIYLIVQTDKAAYGTVDPFLIGIPYTDDESKWVYDVQTKTKGEADQNEPEKPNKEENEKDGPKTGDTSNVLHHTAIMVCAGVVVIISATVWYKQRKKDK